MAVTAAQALGTLAPLPQHPRKKAPPPRESKKPAKGKKKRRPPKGRERGPEEFGSFAR